MNEQPVGHVRGALPMTLIGWERRSTTRVPDIVVSFGSRSMGCDRLMTCAVQISDTPLQEGQDILGAFSRADTWNFMAARGPDFQRRLISRAPASNADIVRTIGELLRLEPARMDTGGGRVLTESLNGRDGQGAPRVRTYVVASKRTSDGYMTEVHLQAVGSTQYFDAAGFSGWTVGIEAQPTPFDWRFWRWDWPRARALTIKISPD